MALETFGYIDDLDPSSPDGATEYVSQGDDHIRGIKLTLQNTFPNLTGAVTVTQDELNQLAGKTILSVSNPTTLDAYGTVTAAAASTTVATLNLGTVASGEVFLIQHQAAIGPASSSLADVGYRVTKASGTATASFSSGGASTTANMVRADLTSIQIDQSGCSLLVVGTSGTLVVALQTWASEGTITVIGRLRAVKLITVS